MKISISNKKAARADGGFSVILGFQWSNMCYYKRSYQRSFCITIFNIDIWFKGEEIISDFEVFEKGKKPLKGFVQQLLEDKDLISS